MAQNDSFLGTLAAVDPSDWGAMGASLLAAPTWQKGLAQGITNVQAQRGQRAEAARQASMDERAKAKFEQDTAMHEKKMAEGDYVKIGPYSLMSTTDQSIISVSPEQMARHAAMKAASKGPKGSEFIFGAGVYDNKGNMWFPTSDKAAGTTSWQGPDGVVTDKPPEGATRPQDSVYGEIGKIQKRYLTNIEDEYTKARGSLQTAQRSLDLLADPDVWTGIGSASIFALKGLMVSAGFASQDTVDAVAKMDEFRKLSFEFVMDQVAGTKGAVSDREMDLFAKASPGLGKTVEGNRRILEGIKLISERTQEQYQFINDLVLTKDMPPYLAEREWTKYAKENPIFTKEWFEIETGKGSAVEPSAAAPPPIPGERLSDEELYKKYVPEL